MNRTLYFDIETVARIKKIQKKAKHASMSKIVRTAVHKVSFDEMIKELNEDQKHWKDISLKNL